MKENCSVYIFCTGSFFACSCCLVYDETTGNYIGRVSVRLLQTNNNDSGSNHDDILPHSLIISFPLLLCHFFPSPAIMYSPFDHILHPSLPPQHILSPIYSLMKQIFSSPLYLANLIFLLSSPLHLPLLSQPKVLPPLPKTLFTPFLPYIRACYKS